MIQTTSPAMSKRMPPSPGGRPARRVRRRRRSQLGRHLVLLFGCLVVFVPFLWFVSIALRPNEQLYQLWPTRLTLEHFSTMVERVPAMVSYYMDSIVVTGTSVAVTAVVSALAGYAFARLRFPGRDLVFWAVVATTFIPPATVLPTLYVELFELGLIDTRLGLVLVYSAWHLGVGTFIMRGIFQAIPEELVDAAKVDGASAWTTLWRIMLPLSAGGLVVVSLITFVWVWGEYLFAFSLAGDEVRPMSVGIKLFQPNATDPTYTFNVAAAAALVMFIPSIVIYIAFQKWFAKGLMEGALKG